MIVKFSLYTAGYSARSVSTSSLTIQGHLSKGIILPSYINNLNITTTFNMREHKSSANPEAKSIGRKSIEELDELYCRPVTADCYL